jgi:hypothetical protein
MTASGERAIRKTRRYGNRSKPHPGLDLSMPLELTEGLRREARNALIGAGVRP